MDDDCFAARAEQVAGAEGSERLAQSITAVMLPADPAQVRMNWMVKSSLSSQDPWLMISSVATSSQHIPLLGARSAWLSDAGGAVPRSSLRLPAWRGLVIRARSWLIRS